MRVPCAKVAGTVASRLAILPKRPDVCRSILRSKSSGTRASSRPTAIATAARAAGIRSREGRLAGEHVGPQQDAEDHERDQVDGVEDHEERDHPADRLSSLHPRLPQGPIGEQDPASPSGGEQPGRRQSRHRDLVALVPRQVDHLLAHDAAEERDVGGEHADAEGHPDRDPDRIPFPDLVDRVLQVEQLRDQNVDRDEQEDDRDSRRDQPFRVRKEARLRLRDDFVGRLFMLRSALLALLPHRWDVRKRRSRSNRRLRPRDLRCARAAAARG